VEEKTGATLSKVEESRETGEGHSTSGNGGGPIDGGKKFKEPEKGGGWGSNIN